ncbi:IclR family transcriptional regulator [Pseudonocardia xinjiangensis]|uniref:IclR family transcriptional regulator n=1 Tax=Pseudonocardia xinjiangensis TaxID=75289 RepID=A0ABX1RB44_9PSEU|nr:IclR family transcriptional regulator [Pseudonocardia xinjiangensis]NMH77626.1 IclR family transcriptional regulator [Pseudonocardia xinjiangensis]
MTPGSDGAAASRRGRSSPVGTSVEKAMRILEALAVEDGPHRLMDVAERAGVPRSTAYRVLATLGAQGFAQNCGDGRYGIGSRLGGLGARVVRMLSTGVGPTLQELQRGAGGNTVHLAVRVGDHAVYLHKVDNDKPYEMRSRVGNQLPLHSTAIGKAILAHLPPGEVEAIVTTAGMASRTPATITEVGALHAELADVRERGFALDDEENELTVRCIGAVVLDRSGRPRGGISVSSVTFMLDREELLGYVPLLQATARKVAGLI